MSDELRGYPTVDYSRTTDTRITGVRRVNPTGAVIHTTGGVNSLHWLTGGSAAAGEPASANVLIARDGKVAVLCSRERYPYHAGRSQVRRGDRQWLDNAVSEAYYGIELEALDVERPTWQQLDSCGIHLVEMAGVYGWRWPLVIYGHYGIALPPGRKHDPYGLDWGALMGYIYMAARAASLPGL